MEKNEQVKQIVSPARFFQMCNNKRYGLTTLGRLWMVKVVFGFAG